EELRYTLRGIHRNLPHGTIHLIGEPPTWVRNVHVIIRGRQANKGRTVSGHLIEASTNPHITENMILFNDDMFILKPMLTVPIHNRGTIREVLERLRRRHSNHGP